MWFPLKSFSWGVASRRKWPRSVQIAFDFGMSRMHSKSRRLAGLETWREAKWHKWYMFPCHHLIHIDTSSFLLNLPSATWIHSCDIHAFATTSATARASEAWQVHKKAMLEKVKDLPVETSVGHSVWGLFPCSFFCSSTTERHNHQLSFCCCYTSCSRKAFVIIRAHRFVVFTGFVPVSCTAVLTVWRFG